MADDIDGPDDLDEEELEPYEEILDEWMDLGWFDLLPTGLMTITSSFSDVTHPRIDFDAISAEELAGRGLALMDDDPLWTVMSEDELPEEERLDDHEVRYAEYLEETRAQYTQWADISSRDPSLAVTTLDELVDLLIRLQLVTQTDGVLELADEVPDPLELLPLNEEEIEKIALVQMQPELGAVEDVLHEFLYHGDNDELSTTLQKLAQQADVEVEVARLAIFMLVAAEDSGISVERFGLLDSDGIEQLREHQKFTLRVDRTAPGFSGHEH